MSTEVPHLVSELSLDYHIQWHSVNILPHTSVQSSVCKSHHRKEVDLAKPCWATAALSCQSAHVFFRNNNQHWSMIHCFQWLCYCVYSFRSPLYDIKNVCPDKKNTRCAFLTIIQWYAFWQCMSGLVSTCTFYISCCKMDIGILEVIRYDSL